MKTLARKTSLTVLTFFRRKLKRINAATPAGFIIPNSPGGDIEGPLEVFFAGLVGALSGFVLGMLIGACTRVATMNARNGCRGGMHWAAYGAGAGAMALAIVELLD